jgi:hypothetical protein
MSLKKVINHAISHFEASEKSRRESSHPDFFAADRSSYFFFSTPSFCKLLNSVIV